VAQRRCRTEEVVGDTVKQELKKLDRRFNGFGHWTHRTDPQGFRSAKDWQLNFFEFRNWMWANYGPGCRESEATALVSIGKEVPLWAWDEYGSIYARDIAMTTLVLAKDRFTRPYGED
jgi:hypothetical protein